MNTARTMVIALMICGVVVTAAFAQSDTAQTARPDPPIVIIDDDPRDDATSGEIPVPRDRGRGRVSFRLHELRWYAPNLGTERWTQGEYGFGLGLNIPVDAPPLRRISPILVYAWTNLGFDGVPGTGNFLKGGAIFDLNGHLSLSATTDGLFASVAGYSHWDGVVEVSWLQRATKVPWRGWYLDASAMTGSNTVDTWLIGRALSQWNWHLVPDTIMFTPSTSVVASLRPGAPDRRLPVIEGGYGSLPNELVAGDGSGTAVYRSAAVFGLRTRLSFPLAELMSNRTGSAKLRLNLSAGPWVGAVNLFGRDPTHSFGWESGLIAAVGLTADTTVKLPNGMVQSIDPLLTVELDVPFSTLSNVRSWRISVLTLLDPSNLFRM